MKHPEINSLYKYRGFNEYSLQALINEVAWFSKPKSFNDPFDCDIQIDERKMEESIQAAVVEAHIKTGHELKDIPKSDFQVSEEDVKAFNNFKQSIFELTQTFGILSLSQVNDDILMWSHYADSHHGFCIEYSRTPDNILGKQAEPVTYQEEQPSLSAQDVTTKGQGFNELWLTKSTHWRYEKEWRLINDEGGKAFQFLCDIKSIIFGLRMCENDRYTIRKILKNRGVVFKEAIRETGRFALCITDEKA